MSYFWAFDVLSLAASCTALLYTVRVKSTYFLGSRLFIALANVGFLVVLLQSTIADFLQTSIQEPLYLSMVSLMLFSVGFASYLLQAHNTISGMREISDFLRHPARKFEFFTLAVVVWTGFVLVFHPYTMGSSNTSDGPVYFVQPEPAFGLANLAVLITFLLLPVQTFYRQSLATRDPKAAGSIRTISVAWASFGLVAFLQSVLPPTVFPSSQSLLQMANGTLFLTIAYALREPTVLGRMIGAPSPHGSGYFGKGGTTIVLYNAESDRKNFVEDFLRAEERDLSETFCYVAKSDVPFYHVLAREATTQYPQQRNAKVVIRSIEDSSLETTSLMELSANRRELVDTEGLGASVCRKFAEDRKRIDQSGRPPRDRIWAISAEAGRSTLLEGILGLNPEARIVDLAKNQNSFSQKLGIVHSDLLGNRILLEFDPISNFEDIVREFVDEFISNVQPVAVFTSLGSPVFKALQNARNARLFVFSSKISTPFRAVDGRVLLPDRDSSLLLDAVDKLVQTNKTQSVALVLEAFTDMVLSQGFEKSYGILSSILELAEAGSSTGLFLLNTACLDDAAVQGIRGLFKLNFRYSAEGLTNVRSSSPAISLPLSKGSTGLEVQDLTMRSVTLS